MSDKTLIIVGASARAAAESAHRAGYRVFGIDLFADRDLAAVAECMRIPGHNYPGFVVAPLDQLPAEYPWMYTGGIETHPEIIDTVSAGRRLIGNDADRVMRLRDSDCLAGLAERARWRFPRCSAHRAMGVNQLQKPVRHCGGVGIRFADEAEPAADVFSFFQEFVEGVSSSACFVGTGRGAQLLGVTQQWLARDWSAHALHSHQPFAYVGSVGPTSLSDEQREHWLRLGEVLAAHVPLYGIFGVDVVLPSRSDLSSWTLIEVNPRWTASVELLERAYRFNGIQLHVAAAMDAALPTRIAGGTALKHVKMIVFAERDIEIDVEFVKRIDQLNRGSQWPAISDVPVVGECIKYHHPIVTVFGWGVDERAAIDRLTENVRQLTPSCHVSPLL